MADVLHFCDIVSFVDVIEHLPKATPMVQTAWELLSGVAKQSYLLLVRRMSRRRIATYSNTSDQRARVT